MEKPEPGPARAKFAAAEKALDFVEPGMIVGLGTGSTADVFVRLLGERVAEGLQITGVPTSTRTRDLAASLNIPLTTLEEVEKLDVVIDGADEFDRRMNLIKGGGGALLQEKLVATAADKMVVITDRSKQVSHLGAFPLPVEVVKFGWKLTAKRIYEVIACAFVGGVDIVRRMDGDKPYITDEGHYILDLHLKKIDEPEKMAWQLKELAGVVDSGFFIEIADAVIVGRDDGTTRVITHRPPLRPFR